MRPGFILLEVIVSLAVSSMVGMLLFGAFFQTHRIMQRIDTITDTQQQFLVTFDQLQRDISGAWIPLYAREQKKNRPPLTHIFYAKEENSQLSTLTFITNNPLDVYVDSSTGSLSPRLVRVTYHLVPESPEAPIEKQSYQLKRTESPSLFYEEANPSSEGYVLAHDIKTCALTYFLYDKKRQNDTETQSKNTWGTEETNSDEKHSLMLPHAVNVTLSLWEKNKKRFHTTNIIIPLQTSETQNALIKNSKPTIQIPKLGMLQ